MKLAQGSASLASDASAASGLTIKVLNRYAPASPPDPAAIVSFPVYPPAPFRQNLTDFGIFYLRKFHYQAPHQFEVIDW